MIRNLVFIILLLVSNFSFALEVEFFEGMVKRAEKVKVLVGNKKQTEAIEIIKAGFKTVKENQKDIPGNEANNLKARLRVIYKDVKNNQFESFYAALNEGKNYLMVYKTTSQLFK